MGVSACMYVCMYAHAHCMKSDLMSHKILSQHHDVQFEPLPSSLLCSKLQTVSVGSDLLNASQESDTKKNPCFGPVIRTHDGEERAVNYLL